MCVHLALVAWASDVHDNETNLHSSIVPLYVSATRCSIDKSIEQKGFQIEP